MPVGRAEKLRSDRCGGSVPLWARASRRESPCSSLLSLTRWPAPICGLGGECSCILIHAETAAMLRLAEAVRASRSQLRACVLTSTFLHKVSRSSAREPLFTSCRSFSLSASHVASVANVSAGAGAAESEDASNSSKRRAVGLWLAALAGGVAAMVVLGGATRLTRSGLSIVEWKLAGEPLPRDEAGWDRVWAAYRTSPEGAFNAHLSRAEFQFIYLMEWAHRAWGRGLGIAFAVPAAAFVLTRRVPPGLGPRLVTLGVLGAAQGGIGWWMVKSGLEHERFPAGGYERPHVSPYRLATHLTAAFSLYALLVWTSLDMFTPLSIAAAPSAASAAAVRRLQPFALATGAFVAATAASGAFVAGNDAGRAYNDWPWFAGRLLPEDLWLPALGMRNIFENTATVQFDHRTLAYATLASVAALHAAASRGAGGRAALPPRLRVALDAVGADQDLLGRAGLDRLREQLVDLGLVEKVRRRCCGFVRHAGSGYWMTKSEK